MPKVVPLRALGEGAFGQVWWATWRGRPVALKKLLTLLFTPSVHTFCSHLLFTPSVHTAGDADPQRRARRPPRPPWHARRLPRAVRHTEPSPLLLLAPSL